MFDLAGKLALVVGVANDHSIAWGCARALRQAGAKVAVTYLNEKSEPHVRPLAEQLESPIIMPLDVSHEQSDEALFGRIGDVWGRLDILVHSIAFAPRADLQGRVIDTSAEGFAQAMDVSVHSFIRLVRQAEPLMTDGGSCQTMSFYGARKVVSSYNVMGPVKAALEATTRELASELGSRNITVNALSPGPMATRAAGGIAEFDDLMHAATAKAPMRRLATIDDVGAACVYLSSRAGRNVTGSVLHVDAGYHAMA